MTRIAGGSDPQGKIYKLLTFAGKGNDVADPWYTGDFDVTYRDVSEGCAAFLDYLTGNRLICQRQWFPAGEKTRSQRRRAREDG